METCPTGIRGLDDLMNGGFPKGRVILLIGGPGSGKTILAAQFLYKGIKDHKENGIFVSLDESRNHFYSEMEPFGWDFAEAEGKKFAFINATRATSASMLKEELYKEDSRALRGKQLPVETLVDEIRQKIGSYDAKRVVVDTLTAMFYRFPDPVERRTAVVDLIQALSDLNTTTLITTELGYLGLERSVLEEEYLVHGVVMMQTLFSEGTTTRALQIEKMRGTKVNPNLVPYTIDRNGIEVYPNMPLFGEK
ncbi:MAG TPA: ATPase domain-containing protein [Candidatus Eisenbacteria bacterium]|jgi:circadian clock protein KaiC|nr:ATPase domain-containing protein [Candidatus Eisenbacteria bacterium]